MGFIFGLVAAFAAGFTAHRASLCSVRAVAEIFTTQRVFLMASFLKVSVWVFCLSFLFMTLLDQGPTFQHWPMTGLSVGGGLIFGAGAAINGACAFGTITRLGDGDLNFWATVLGWPVGAWIAEYFFSSALPAPLPVSTPLQGGISQPVLWTLVLGCTAWVVWQSIVIGRAMTGSRSLTKSILAPRYRLSAAAALLATANIVLYAQFGDWSFTSVTLSSVSPSLFPPDIRIEWLWLVLAVTLSGVYVSAKLRRSFNLQAVEWHRLVRHGSSGLAMGIGAALIPGGNDSLVLYAMAALSPHALPAYASVLAGISICLALQRQLGQPIEGVYCSADLCMTPPLKEPG